MWFSVAAGALLKPTMESSLDESVVAKVAVRQVHAIDFCGLTFAQPLGRIHAPDALEKPLTTQHLMTTCNAPVKVVSDVEESRIAVGDARIQGEETYIDPL